MRKFRWGLYVGFAVGYYLGFWRTVDQAIRSEAETGVDRLTQWLHNAGIGYEEGGE